MAFEVKENALRENSSKIAGILQKGGIAVYPTETSYGIGCGISHRAAVERIFLLKKRPKSQPLPVIAANQEMMEEFAVVVSAAEKLVEKFMPGPLTLILDRKRSVPEWFPRKTIAIRIPGNETARELCRLAGEPVVSTSANISGERQFYEIKQALKEFEKKVNLIINAGDLEYNTPSTLFDVEHRRMVREGKIKKEQIDEALSQ